MPKPNPKTVEQMLQDCIAADPALRGREEELRPLIATLLESRPDTHFNETFAEELRTTLTNAIPRSHAPTLTLSQSLMRPLKFIYMVPAGAFVAALVAVALVGPLSNSPRLQQEPSVADSQSGAMTFTKLAAGAFGSLSGVTPPGGSPENAARPQSGGGGGLGSSVAISAAPPMDSKMIAPGMPFPEPVNYRFVWDGGPLEGLTESVNVYRRIKGLNVGGSVVNTLKGLTGGLANLSGLQGTKLANFSILEDREFGLAVSVDAVEGSVSLSQNWLRWPHPENECRDDACWQSLRLSMGQVPSDDALIATANAFLEQYGISREHYGQPVVNSNWRPVTIMAEAEVYVPDSISVTYPLVVNGSEVNDDAGLASGLIVNVNIRHNRVDGVWGLTTNSFEESAYAAETSTERILDVLAKGGTWGGWYDENSKTVEVRVGAPEMILRRSWVNGPNGTSEELLVPALRFPLIDPPQELAWRTSVVVPLAKEVLDQMNQGYPMPLMKAMEGGDAAASAPSSAPAPAEDAMVPAATPSPM